MLLMPFVYVVPAWEAFWPNHGPYEVVRVHMSLHVRTDELRDAGDLLAAANVTLQTLVDEDVLEAIVPGHTTKRLRVYVPDMLSIAVDGRGGSVLLERPLCVAGYTLCETSFGCELFSVQLANLAVRMNAGTGIIEARTAYNGRYSPAYVYVENVTSSSDLFSTSPDSTASLGTGPVGDEYANCLHLTRRNSDIPVTLAELPTYATIHNIRSSQAVRIGSLTKSRNIGVYSDSADFVVSPEGVPETVEVCANRADTGLGNSTRRFVPVTYADFFDECTGEVSARGLLHGVCRTGQTDWRFLDESVARALVEHEERGEYPLFNAAGFSQTTWLCDNCAVPSSADDTSNALMEFPMGYPLSAVRASQAINTGARGVLIRADEAHLSGVDSSGQRDDVVIQANYTRLA